MYEVGQWFRYNPTNKLYRLIRISSSRFILAGEDTWAFQAGKLQERGFSVSECEFTEYVGQDFIDDFAPVNATVTEIQESL